MSPEQMVGYVMLNTSAITNLVSTRIYHGLRPVSSTVPCINFYRVSGTRMSGMESIVYSINCRATTAATALQVARKVIDLFHGTSSRGVYGSENSFEISRSSLARDGGLIPETEDKLFNCPIDIQVVFPTSSVT